jgi:hypothetical protein
MKLMESTGEVPLRFRQRKIGSKGDTTREVIASKDGNVARLVERDGQPLSAEEDAEERARLNEELNSPDDFLKRQRRDGEVRDSALKMVGLMPQAMIYSFAADQTPAKNAVGKEVVVDFHPNPAFHPPTMYAEARGWRDGCGLMRGRTR